MKPLVRRLIAIRKVRATELASIRDVFGDPIELAKYYVEPSCQHYNPANYNEDEPISYVRSPIFRVLGEFFLREFVERDGRSQMFILSDAGMGKSSLLVMLKLAQLTSFWPSNQRCVLIKLDSQTVEKIGKIEDRGNVIILLDALDEDPTAWVDVEERVSTLLTMTTNYRRVIISCRTQYFPEHGSTPFNKNGQIEIGGFLCPVLYLSLFDDDQVRTYLQKRFARTTLDRCMFRDNPNLDRAHQIIPLMHSLKYRPLLLSHIEDILDTSSASWSDYAIFQALVDTWLLREERKLRQLDLKISITRELLWQACITLASAMQQASTREISEEALAQLTDSSPEIAHVPKFHVGGRSLLNRDSKGKYRFSHFIIHEFLLAKGIIEGHIPRNRQTQLSDDAVRSFVLSAENSSVSLNGLSFRQQDLRNANFGDRDLQNSDFELAKLDGGTFDGSDASGAKFTYATLTQSSYKDVKLHGADFSFADGSAAEFDRSELPDASFLESLLNGASLRNTLANGIDLSRASISRTTFADGKFSDSNFDSATGDSVDFRGANLDRASLNYLQLKDANFYFASMLGVQGIEVEIESSDFSKTDLSDSNWQTSSFKKCHFNNARLTNADFSQSTFSKTDFTGANLSNAELAHSVLTRACFSGAVAESASFQGADLSGATIIEANFTNADLRSANLLHAMLNGTNLETANLSGANLFGAKLQNCEMRICLPQI